MELCSKKKTCFLITKHKKANKLDTKMSMRLLLSIKKNMKIKEKPNP